MTEKSDYDWKVSVSGKALRQLLEAIAGPEHLLRELKVTAGLGDLGGTLVNPLALIFQQFNEEVARLKNPPPAPEPEQTPMFAELPPAPPPPPPAPEPGDEYTLKFAMAPLDPMYQQPPQEYVGHSWVQAGVRFGETDLLDLLDLVMQQSDSVHNPEQKYPHYSRNGVFSEILTVTDFLVEVDCEGTKHQFTLPITGGKQVAVSIEGGPLPSTAFNVTMRYKDRLFTFEGFMLFNPKTGLFTAEVANFVTDIGMHKLAASLDLPGIADSIKPIGIHLKGEYHTHVLKDPAKNS